MKNLVTMYKYCAGCLSHDHIWRTCVSTGKCKRCGDINHTLLHKPDNRPRSSGLKKVAKSKRGNRNRKSPARTNNTGPRSSRRKNSGRISGTATSRPNVFYSSPCWNSVGLWCVQQNHTQWCIWWYGRQTVGPVFDFWLSDFWPVFA